MDEGRSVSPVTVLHAFVYLSGRETSSRINSTLSRFSSKQQSSIFLLGDEKLNKEVRK